MKSFFSRVLAHLRRPRSARRPSTAAAPARLLVFGFLILIACGTVGLRTLPGLYTGKSLSWLDSLFTATSAVCVTGLVVVDTATYFTPLGQGFLLLLIQLGGLGILALTTLALLALGRRPRFSHETAAENVTAVFPEFERKTILLGIVISTFLLEAVGAAVLFLLWRHQHPVLPALGHAVFHAVSAFCNAGFSTFSDSLAGVRGSMGSLGVISLLVILGGLGFLPLYELARKTKGQTHSVHRSISLHSRLVLLSSAVLILGGALLFLAFEWRGVLRAFPIEAKVANSFFMSVTPRTAGFNTVEYAELSEESIFLTILLMSIGGSPGSTAGGIKTTTVALIALLALTRLRGYSAVSVWGRSVPSETVNRAVGLFVLMFGTMTAAVFMLSLLRGEVSDASVHRDPFLAEMFEVVSAYNTVGLSLGLTPDLHPPAKLLVAVLMFIGRVGPLAVVASLARRRKDSSDRFRFSREDVMIG